MDFAGCAGPETRYQPVILYYRKLNNMTKKDAYPIPRIDDTLDTMLIFHFRSC